MSPPSQLAQRVNSTDPPPARQNCAESFRPDPRLRSPAASIRATLWAAEEHREVRKACRLLNCFIRQDWGAWVRRQQLCVWGQGCMGKCTVSLLALKTMFTDGLIKKKRRRRLYDARRLDCEASFLYLCRRGGFIWKALSPAGWQAVAVTISVLNRAGKSWKLLPIL